MKKYLTPVIIYLCFAGFYVGFSQVKHTSYLYQPVWDVAQYVDISERGYDAHPCTSYDYPPGKICGNVGWYPMWPIVIAAVRPLVGGSSQTAVVLLTFLFTLLGFLFLFNFAEKRFGAIPGVVMLAAIAFGPSSFYFLAGFPYALMLLLFSLYLPALYGPSGIKRELILFITALAFSLCYPSALFLVILPVVWHFLNSRKTGISIKSLNFWLNLGKYALPYILGPLLLWGYFYLRFDDFFLQLHFQEKYHRTWTIPLVTMYKSLTFYPIFSPENIVIWWYGLLLLVFIPYEVGPELWLPGLFLYLLSPATGTTLSIYRHYLVIFPAYLIIGASRRPLWLKVIFILVGFFLAIMVLFPGFISNRLI